MFRPLTVTAALLAFALPSFGQGRVGDFVSADARWIAHVDVSRVFEAEMVGEIMAREGVSLDDEEFQDMKTAVGLDPATDVHSITVYGTAADPERAVAVLAGNVKLEQALDRLVMHLKREDTEVSGLTLQHWRERDSHDNSEDIYTYIARRVDSDERLILAAANAADVVHAARVIRGEAPALAGAGSSLKLNPSADSVVFVSASADLLDSLDVDAPDEVLKMLDSLRLEVGESTGKTYVDVQLGLHNKAQADQIVAMITGLKAAAELVGVSEPDVRQALPLLRSVSVSNNDGKVHLRLDVSNTDLLALIDQQNGDSQGADVRFSTEVDFKTSRSEPASAGSTGWR